MPAEKIRTLLIEMLLKWKKGDVSERDVHEMAEDLLERQEDESARSDKVEQEALIQLDALPQQWITVEDVSAMVTLLQTPRGEEAKGLAEWSEYWENIDFRKRARQVASNPYYSKSGPYT